MLSDKQLEALREEVRAARAPIEAANPDLATYLDAAREYERERVRKDYEGLFNLIRRHGRRSSALLIGLTVALLLGGALAAVFTIEIGERPSESRVIALQAKGIAIEVKNARRLSIIASCNEENVEHREAQAAIEVLAHVMTPRKPTDLKLDKRHVPDALADKKQGLLDGFVNAFRPPRDCTKRVAQYTHP